MYFISSSGETECCVGNREQLMTWSENFVDDFNYKERTGKSNLIIPCLTKVGQNCFSADMEVFTGWLDSLKTNPLNKSLLQAHTALKLQGLNIK